MSCPFRKGNGVGLDIREAGMAPRFPSASPVLDENATYVRAIYTFQFRDEATLEASMYERIRASFAIENAPYNFYFTTKQRDEKLELDTQSVLAYWDSKEKFRAWSAADGAKEWCTGRPWLNGSIGFYSQISILPRSSIEGMFSGPEHLQDPLDGFSRIATDQYLEQEHDRLGAARDRIPDLKGKPIEAECESVLAINPPAKSYGVALKVTPPANVCTIITAQNWTECDPEEKTIYVDKLQPVLQAGVEHLATHPVDTGCISATLNTWANFHSLAAIEKSACVANFASMTHLEVWTWTHPKHGAIYKTFMSELVGIGKFGLRLWHEINVHAAGNLECSFVNCHPETSFLAFYPSEEIEV